MHPGKQQEVGLSTSSNKVLKELYERYAKKLLGYTRKNYMIDKDDALAVVYKTIFKIAAVTITFENEQKRSAFIFKTHINFLRNFFRDQKSFEKDNYEVELSDEISTVASETENPVNVPLLLLQQELEKLEDWQRILVLMRGQDMPYSEIAAFVKKPEDQLKVYYARLKKQLAENVNAALQQLKTSHDVNL